MKTAAALTLLAVLAGTARADDEEVLAPIPERKVVRPAQPAPVEAPVPSGLPLATSVPPEPQLEHSRVPEIVASIATGALVLGIVGAHVKWSAAQELARKDKDVFSTGDGLDHYRHIQDAEKWRKVTWGLVGATFVSSMVTAFLWTRHQTSASFSVDPDEGGASAMITHSF